MKWGKLAGRYVARRAVYRALPRRGPAAKWRHGVRWAGLRFGVGWGVGRLFRAFRFWR